MDLLSSAGCDRPEFVKPWLRWSLLVFTALSLTAEDGKPVHLKLRDLSGNKVTLEQYRGELVVLNFWATWCGPCRDEMPTLVAAEKSWAAKGVAFIAVSLDDRKTIDKVPEFVSRFHVTFPVWTGAQVDDLEGLHLGAGIPDTMFLNKKGFAVARVLGEMQGQELEQRLKWLTGDREGPPPPALVNHM